MILKCVQVKWQQLTVRVCGSWCLVGFLPSCSTTPSWHTSSYAFFDWTWRVCSFEFHSTHAISQTCSRWIQGRDCVGPVGSWMVLWLTLSLSVCAVFGLGQSTFARGFCGSSALPGYSWNCSGASSHSAGPALSVCHTGAAAQVHTSTVGAMVSKANAFKVSLRVCVCALQVCVFTHLWARQSWPAVPGCISKPLFSRAFSIPASRWSRLRCWHFF